MENEQSHDSLKVLIADDDAPTRILLRAAISQWGYEVVEVKDGEEAWEVMQEANPPRLLIVDWLMPKLTGIDLAKRVKHELPRYAYIIFLTQQSGTTNLIKGLEAGADEFLSKPFNMGELRSRLSIGARIVRYEISISRQNEKLRKHLSQIEAAAITALEMTEQLIESLMTHHDKQTTIDHIRLEKLQGTLNNLDTIISVINEYRRDPTLRE